MLVPYSNWAILKTSGDVGGRLGRDLLNALEAGNAVRSNKTRFSWLPFLIVDLFQCIA